MIIHWFLQSLNIDQANIQENNIQHCLSNFELPNALLIELKQFKLIFIIVIIIMSFEQIQVKLQENQLPLNSQHIELLGTIKSRLLLKQLKEQQSVFKFYSWDFRENYTYICYLKHFRHIFNSQAQRKRIKVFNHISKLLTTRNPHQIKSHHQKMMLRHKDVDSIIQYFCQRINGYLSKHPEYIYVIELVNRESAYFFLQEMGLENSGRIKLQLNCNQITFAEEIQANYEVKQVIKEQENVLAGSFEQINLYKNNQSLPTYDLIKQEEQIQALLFPSK